MRVKLEDGAYEPTKAHPEDAGYDLYSREESTINPGASHRFDTGVSVEIPHGYVGIVCGRSGMNFNSSLTLDGVGVIDEGYTGTIGVKIYNHGDWTQFVQVGQRIAQLVIVPRFSGEVEIVDSLDKTERGDNGFGSSGK